MSDKTEKIKMKDIEFRAYKFKSKASRKVRKRMRRAAKRVKHQQQGEQDV